ncbi:VanZ family protein [Compostibacter hankyongensis]|uniref:VanZ family protein n=1 Tax=Compostibacter hankyongensis TaxID=1007089 RepID=A0ABP8FEI8_9BACT
MKSKNPFLLFIPALVWTLIVLTATLMPGRDVPHVSIFDRFPHFDKLVHGTLFFGFVFLWGWAFRQARGMHHLFRLLLFVTLAGIALGIGIEYLQEYVVKRDFEFLDMVADATGAVIGLLLLLLFPQKKKVRG